MYSHGISKGKKTNKQNKKTSDIFDGKGYPSPPLGSVFRDLTTRAAKFHVLQIIRLRLTSTFIERKTGRVPFLKKK